MTAKIFPILHPAPPPDDPAARLRHLKTGDGQPLQVLPVAAVPGAKPRVQETRPPTRTWLRILAMQIRAATP